MKIVLDWINLDEEREGVVDLVRPGYNFVGKSLRHKIKELSTQNQTNDALRSRLLFKVGC